MNSSWRLIFLSLFYLLYLFLGATVFSAIEHPLEGEMLGELHRRKRKFLETNTCVQEKNLDSYIDHVVSNSRRGVTLVSDQVPNWSFGQSFFFSGTVITTIGYGQQTPLSPQGKMFCILYVILGIPLTFLLFTVIIDRLMVPTEHLLTYLTIKLSHIYSEFRVRMVYIGLVAAGVAIFFILLPATVLYTLEPGWNWFDSFYYCLISLTTVGLGDFVPGDQPRQSSRDFYKTIVTVYLVLGVMAMMFLMRVFHSIPELDIHMWFNDQAAMGDDPEKQRLQASGGAGMMYSQTDLTLNKEQRRVVRARSRRDDSEEGVVGDMGEKVNGGLVEDQ